MATSKVSQGLSFSTIVLAVISIFILVLVILFVSRGLGPVGTSINVYSRTDLESAQVACRAYCDTAIATSDSFDAFKRSDYCQRSFAVTVSGAPAANAKCQGPPVSVGCIGTISGGPVSIASTNPFATDDNGGNGILNGCTATNP